MEKKSLGRGLEDISNIFLSTGEEVEEKKMTHGFSPTFLREASCASCTNLLEKPSGHPKCRVFSLESEAYGLPTLESIALSYARNCEYFKHIARENIYARDVSKSGYSYEAEDECEVEETVNARRTIALENDENAQQNMRRAVSEHLKEGYSIRRIELRKIGDISEPRSRVRTEEDVTIFIKSSLSP